ncbi:hypothetical protein EVAR_44064_1 [Eumeta japonica]|uniref:Uncharacterized protein n=1 Tax=Eumeta variegata TaxID=151549 RepID=A0A4C1X0H1_EUMVA|nr:hypothetical protein EVAR_44064_1 [Eumeta japonica]
MYNRADWTLRDGCVALRPLQDICRRGSYHLAGERLCRPRAPKARGGPAGAGANERDAPLVLRCWHGQIHSHVGVFRCGRARSRSPSRHQVGCFPGAGELTAPCPTAHCPQQYNAGTDGRFQVYLTTSKPNESEKDKSRIAYLGGVRTDGFRLAEKIKRKTRATRKRQKSGSGAAREIREALFPHRAI